MRVLYNVRTQWPLRSHRVQVWAANIAIEWLPSGSITEEHWITVFMLLNGRSSSQKKKKIDFVRFYITHTPPETITVFSMKGLTLINSNYFLGFQFISININIDRVARPSF